ncbi:hypothetical protein M8J77_010007 [Diaphorina citri]|nr:hypothetical protein M8J77_010007 [Diaphorina citri]
MHKNVRGFLESQIKTQEQPSSSKTDREMLPTQHLPLCSLTAWMNTIHQALVIHFLPIHLSVQSSQHLEATDQPNPQPITLVKYARHSGPRD